MSIRHYLNILEAAERTFRTLDDLKKWARKLGVKLDASEHRMSGPGYRTTITLDWIERKKKAPKGTGSTVMMALCDYADRMGALITLQAADEVNLPAYYEEFGFEEFEDEDADHDVRPSGPDMRRFPEPA